MNLKEIPTKLKSFALECKRVFFITKKPTMQDFKVIVKVSAIGMLIIGFIGFVITLVYQLAF